MKHTRNQRIRNWGVGEREVADMIRSGFIVEKSEEVKTEAKAGKPVRILLQEVKDDHNKNGEKWIDLRGK